MEKELRNAFATLVPNDLEPFREEIQKDTYKWYRENIAKKEEELVEIKSKMDKIEQKKERLHNHWLVLNDTLKRLGFASFNSWDYTEIKIRDPKPYVRKTYDIHFPR